MTPRHTVLGMLTLLLAGSASAAASVPAWAGVWHGSIGPYPVQVCFEHNDAGGDLGWYYYLRHRQFIGLSPEAKARAGGGVWLEDQADKHVVTWTLDGILPKRLTGTWAAGGKTLPITLERAGTPGVADRPCTSDAFHAPRELPPKRVFSPATLDGIGYRSVRLEVPNGDAITHQGFELLGTGAAVERVNRALNPKLPQTAAELADFYSCSRSTLNVGGPGEYDETTRPTLLTRSWLVAETTESGFCGGAHPFVGTQYRTWNLVTGAAVDPWTWFDSETVTLTRHPGEGKNPGYSEVKVGATLGRILEKKWSHDDADCADVMSADAHPTLMLRPGKTGLLFTPVLPHVIYACTEDIEIPYAQIKRFLNAEGKAAVASIHAELKKTPSNQ